MEIKGKIYEVDLSESTKPKYHYKKIKFKGITKGKSISSYSIPRKIKITCKRDKKIRCVECPLGNETIFELNEYNTDILKFLDISENKISKLFINIFKINPKCFFEYSIIDSYNIEEIFIIPIIQNKNYITITGYYIGHGIECNKHYNLIGYTAPDPRSQKLIHVITKCKPLKEEFERFRITKSIHKNLCIFKPEEVTIEGIYCKLKHIYNTYASNITKIHGRFDLHMAIDLAFHSPLSFYFGNEYVKKAWADVFILGDTRCGKGFVCERLSKWYKLGEVISAENVSYAGLVGGIENIGGRFVITWGKIPQNDKKLVVLDELSDMLNGSSFSRLSRIRSEGMAEITKIHTEITNSRTRLVFLGNPKEEFIDNYTYGIMALNDLFKHPEDVARFDYVLIVKKNEVDTEIINTKKDKIDSPYKRNAETDLICWIWSKEKNDIIFSDAAYDLILKLAIKLGRVYDFSIPLIQSENVRIKLAKVAAMIAGRTYSELNNGEKLYVDVPHVQAAFTFFNLIYKKEPSGYYQYSKQKAASNTIKNEQRLEKYLQGFKSYKTLLRYFLQTNYININDISENLNRHKDVAREIISNLIRHNCVQKKYTYYVKTGAFCNYLKKKQGSIL